jgi:hypothetical protein
MNTITIQTEALPALLAPFIGARRGWEAHQELEIHTAGVRRINAIYCGIDGDNLKLTYGGFYDYLPMDRVTAIVIRDVDADGNWGAETTYTVTPAMQVAA